MSKCTKIDIPTSFVLLGGTGDLAQKKLLNALMDLFDKGVLPSRFRVVAFSKDELSTEEYRTFVRNIIAGKKKVFGTH
jgi:glucose-6-phosphate 1-dehydrogenase